MHERPHPKWPDLDDRVIVAEMLANPNSNHWFECRNFIQKVVQIRGTTIPDYFKEDIVQNTMISVVTGLANFHFDCKLTHWLAIIANNRIIDIGRKHSYVSQWIAPPNNPSRDTEDETEALKVPDPKTTEEKCLIREELYEVHKELLAYLLTRLHPERDYRILIMAWIDRLSHEEIASRIGVSAPVVGYVVRSAQSYLRKKMKSQQLPPELPL